MNPDRLLVSNRRVSWPALLAIAGVGYKDVGLTYAYSVERPESMLRTSRRSAKKNFLVIWNSSPLPQVKSPQVPPQERPVTGPTLTSHTATATAPGGITGSRIPT